MDNEDIAKIITDRLDDIERTIMAHRRGVERKFLLTNGLIACVLILSYPYLDTGIKDTLSAVLAALIVGVFGLDQWKNK